MLLKDSPNKSIVKPTLSTIITILSSCFITSSNSPEDEKFSCIGLIISSFTIFDIYAKDFAILPTLYPAIILQKNPFEKLLTLSAISSNHGEMEDTI